jgi:hypothetical protein
MGEVMSEEALAAKRAEIAAKVAAARKLQDEAAAAQSGGSSGGGGGKKKALSKKALQAALDDDSGGDSGGGGNTNAALSRKEKVKAALEEHKMPSAETLRRQAREMKRNPGMVRRANPAMRKFTDAEIREHANEMEKMANNPEMIHAIKSVQSMPEEERAALLQLQEGLNGKVTRDDKWIADTIKLVKAQPDTLKNLLKGRVDANAPVSEGQILAIIDYVVTCSDGFLTSALKLVNWAISMCGPAVATYQMVDIATFGCARYVVLGVTLLIVFYMGKIVWYLLTLAFGLGMSGYVWLTDGGQAAAARTAAGHSASAATPVGVGIDGVEHPFDEL